MRQYVNAISPANFASTNPDVIRKTLATGGLNLLTGFSNLLDDLARGDGLVKHRAPDKFELGKNIAATPGAVRLSEPADPADPVRSVHGQSCQAADPLHPAGRQQVPYHFDLSPKTSFLEMARRDQGHSVFVISWINPDERHAEAGIEAYMKLGPLSAIDAIERATGEQIVNIVSFCMGGTLDGGDARLSRRERRGGSRCVGDDACDLARFLRDG